MEFGGFECIRRIVQQSLHSVLEPFHYPSKNCWPLGHIHGSQQPLVYVLIVWDLPLLDTLYQWSLTLMDFRAQVFQQMYDIFQGSAMGVPIRTFFVFVEY